MFAGVDSGTIDDKTLTSDCNWPSYSVVYALNVNDNNDSDDLSKVPIHSRCYLGSCRQTLPVGETFDTWYDCPTDIEKPDVEVAEVDGGRS
jgi:hypothetical protein